MTTVPPDLCLVLHKTVDATAGVNGNQFFERMIIALTDALGMRYALVGELNADKDQVATIAACADGKAIANFDYSLLGTPCAQVLGDTTCVFLNNASELYPQDSMLVEMGIDSYIGTPLLNSKGVPIGVLAVFDDKPVSNAAAAVPLFELLARQVAAELDRLHTEEALKLSAAVFDYASEGILICDAKKRVLSINRAYTRITGFSEAEMRGTVPLIYRPERYEAGVYQAMWQAVASEGFWQGEVFDRRKSGEVYTQWLSISQVDARAAEPQRYVAVFSDISSLKHAQERLSFLAHHDPLTGLPNRNLLQQRIQFAIARAKRRDSRVALLFIDLDRFKVVNDTLGHNIGDQLLKAVGKRLVRAMRDVDVIARLGGDEFVLLLEEIDDPSAAVVVAERVIACLSDPFPLEDHEVLCTSSVGISLFPDDGNEMQTLIKCADMAMYQAKELGRNGFQFFKAENNMRSLERLSLEAALRRATERNELLLHYQPVVDVGSGAIVGVEALVRWKHPDLGLVAPGNFIPLAEETGLILGIGAWVLNEACMQMKQWHDQGFSNLTMAINLSPRQFRQAGLQDVVRTALKNSGLNPVFLELEITEGVLMQNVEETLLVLHEFEQMGIRLLMDDFGTGYSSLSYLKRFPIHTLKIDRSFVSGLPDDHDDAALAGTIIAMAHALKLDVIAEGVEKNQQLSFLCEQGCERYQGFLFSAPQPAADIQKNFVKPAEISAATP